MANVRNVNGVAWMFIGSGVVALVGLGSEILTGLSSYGLTSARAEITQSRTGSITSTDADGNRETDDTALIDFRYWVDETERSGSGVYLADPTPKTSLLLNAGELVRRYSPGTETNAYYDPGDLSRVCL